MKFNMDRLCYNNEIFWSIVRLYFIEIGVVNGL